MNKYFTLALLAGVTAISNAQSFSESFDVITGTPAATSYTLTADNAWEVRNFSAPTGATNWFQGNATVFSSQAGPANGYVGVNYQTTTGANAINTFLMSQVRTFNNGDTISFFTRTVTNPAQFPDRLHVKLSTNGSGTADADSATTLLTVNPGLTGADYPGVWTGYTATISGLSGPTAGRFAFNYELPDGGPLGNNSDYIGIDTVRYTAVPEPASMTALGLGALAMIRRRRSAK